ncbi:MAG: LysM peptidoglycan-binding domain-containing protein [bacterium]|nr:LysM peptidoglycan-binding domain-containing protein [bacterium]
MAARYYGDGVKAELLRRYNEGVRELTAGHELFVPVYDDGYGAQAEYEVLDGENLWAIAKKVYGKGHLWNEIWEANKDRLKNPDAVRAGVVLRIP